MTGLVRSIQEGAEEGSKSKADAKVVKIETEAKESEKTSVQHTYDVQWKAPHRFLEEIQYRDLLKRTFEEIRIGELFILAGKLSLVDFRIYSKVWDILADQEQRNQAMARHTNLKTGKRTSTPNNNELGLRIFGSIEQPVIINFESKGRRFWSTGESDAIVGSNNLSLKYGSIMPGVWYMLAILDSLGEESVSEDD